MYDMWPVSLNQPSLRHFSQPFEPKRHPRDAALLPWFWGSSIGFLGGKPIVKAINGIAGVRRIIDQLSLANTIKRIFRLLFMAILRWHSAKPDSLTARSQRFARR